MRTQYRGIWLCDDRSVWIEVDDADGTGILTALTQLLLLVTMTAHLLVADVERTLFWLFGYLPAHLPPKIRRSLSD